MSNWKKLPFIRGEYSISKGGAVHRHQHLSPIKNGRYFRSLPELTLESYLDKQGHPAIGLVPAGEAKKKVYRISFLVASAFIDNPNGFTKVRNINGNKEDVRVENLEWHD